MHWLKRFRTSPAASLAGGCSPAKPHCNRRDGKEDDDCFTWTKGNARGLVQTHKRGVRGGAIHDFLHAYAAELHGCNRIVTNNVSDFEQVTELEVVSP